MMDGVVAAPENWTRVRWTRAAQVTPLLGEPLSLDAIGALSPASAFAVLRDDDPVVATRFVAQCLSRIDAVRWMVDCLALADVVPPPARAVALKAVRRWAASPSEDARRLAYEAGEISGWDTMEGLACLAVFLSGGSMAPAAQEQPVNPQPGLFGKVVASTVLLAAQSGDGPGFAGLAAMLAGADAIAAGKQPA